MVQTGIQRTFGSKLRLILGEALKTWPIALTRWNERAGAKSRSSVPSARADGAPSSLPRGLMKSISTAAASLSLASPPVSPIRLRTVTSRAAGKQTSHLASTGIPIRASASWQTGSRWCNMRRRTTGKTFTGSSLISLSCAPRSTGRYQRPRQAHGCQGGVNAGVCRLGATAALPRQDPRNYARFVRNCLARYAFCRQACEQNFASARVEVNTIAHIVQTIFFV